MSVWTTKSLNKECNYIVLKHTLRGVNYVVGGVKFRDGFAVVEKNSKTYFMLKKINVLKNAEELPLIHLRKLKFITKNLDVKIVYGQDVYRQYLKVLTQEQEKEQKEASDAWEKEHIATGGCLYVSPQHGTICAYTALEDSPSQYCKMHILEDPKLEDLGISVPRFIAKDEKDKIKNKVIKQLEKAKAGYGKNNGEKQEKAE